MYVRFHVQRLMTYARNALAVNVFGIMDEIIAVHTSTASCMLTRGPCKLL